MYCTLPENDPSPHSLYKKLTSREENWNKQFEIFWPVLWPDLWSPLLMLLHRQAVGNMGHFNFPLKIYCSSEHQLHLNFRVSIDSTRLFFSIVAITTTFLCLSIHIDSSIAVNHYLKYKCMFVQLSLKTPTLCECSTNQVTFILLPSLVAAVTKQTLHDTSYSKPLMNEKKQHFEKYEYKPMQIVQLRKKEKKFVAKKKKKKKV